MSRSNPGAARRGLAAWSVLVVAAVAGCQAGGPRGGFTPPPMPVEIATAATQRVADRFDAVGGIEAGEAIDVVSEIDAVVESMPFVEGRPIAKGGMIAQLDDRQLQAEYQRAAAVRDQARASFERVKSVVDQGAGAPQDLDDARSALKVAEANVSLAQTRLDKARITAPFAGIAGAKRVSPGAYLRSGTVITDLAAIDEIKVTFSTPERYLGELHRGAPVTVSTTAYPGYELTGRIDVIDPVLDPATRSSQVIARVRNPGGKFRPGMSANVSVVLSQRPDAVTVPNEAVFSEGGLNFVYLVKPDSTVARSPLTLGTRLADVVEVVKGIDAGQRVVAAGHQKLFDGAKVIPIQSTAGTPDPAAAGAGAAAKGDAKAAPAKGKGSK
ncbi:MAG TPA: efflux RND transporter periplasmic adaptor subunit [Candidatus Eisenbacteria bacterium]